MAKKKEIFEKWQKENPERELLKIRTLFIIK
jgi:hypothetical protein